MRSELQYPSCTQQLSAHSGCKRSAAAPQPTCQPSHPGAGRWGPRCLPTARGHSRAHSRGRGRRRARLVAPPEPRHPQQPACGGPTGSLVPARKGPQVLWLAALRGRCWCPQTRPCSQTTARCPCHSCGSGRWRGTWEGRPRGGRSMRCADMASGSSSVHRTATWAEQVGVEYSVMPVMGVGKASGVVDCALWN